MEKIFLYIPRDAFGDNVSHICLKSKANHPEKLLISLAISKREIFCHRLFRLLKIKLPKATDNNVSHTHLWPFSKSKFNLKSDPVKLVALASPIECLLHLPNVLVIQYKLGSERLTRLGNSNVLRLPVLRNLKTMNSKLNSVIEMCLQIQQCKFEDEWVAWV